MSIVSDNMHPSSEPAARNYARSSTRAVGQRPVARQMQPVAEPFAAPSTDSVTLEKVGDFLELDLRRVSVWMGKWKLAIAGMIVVGAVAGGAYGMFSKPTYTVTSDILIDPAGLQVLGDVPSANQTQLPDTALLAASSKLRVMTSGNVLSRVVSDLNLTNDPEFADPEGAVDPNAAALSALRKAIKITADEKSFVASMAVTTEDVDKSILISNAVFVTFQDELAKAEAQGSDRIVNGIDGRLDELKQAASDSDAAVEAYKKANGLQSSAGELTSTLILNDLNTQVAAAQGRVIAAQATYDQLNNGGTGSSEGGQNTTLDTLRGQLAVSQQQLQSQSMLYGSRHPIIVKLQTEVSALKSQVASETNRMVAAAKTQLDTANSALQALTDKTSRQKAAVFTDSQALVQLRDLERDAKTKAGVYEAFLTRSQQLTESSNLDTSNIRVISTATPPLGRTWPPRTVLMVLIGAGAGLFAGIILALGLGIGGDMRGPRKQRTA